MINNEELLFVVNENNQPLKPKPRSVAHKNFLWHRTTGVWIVNRNKQVLCQKRSLKKDIRPGIWEAFFGGHLAPNEDYKHNAIVELIEELGTKINKDNLIPYKVFKSDKTTHKEFQQVFALILDKNIDEFVFEKDEIDQLSWKTIEELKNILVDGINNDWVHKPWDEEVLNWISTLF